MMDISPNNLKQVGLPQADYANSIRGEEVATSARGAHSTLNGGIAYAVFYQATVR